MRADWVCWLPISSAPRTTPCLCISRACTPPPPSGEAAAAAAAACPAAGGAAWGASKHPPTATSPAGAGAGAGATPRRLHVDRPGQHDTRRLAAAAAARSGLARGRREAAAGARFARRGPVFPRLWSHRQRGRRASAPAAVGRAGAAAAGAATAPAPASTAAGLHGAHERRGTTSISAPCYATCCLHPEAVT